MSAPLLFLVLLVIGILVIVIGAKVESGKAALIIVGIVLALISGYGLFTSLI